MKILIVVATADEIAPSLDWLHKEGCEVLITGVGMLCTVYALTKKLQQDRYDVVVNVGVGGLLHQEAPLGEVYRIVQDEIFQFGAENGEGFIPMEELGFAQSTFYEDLPETFKNATNATKTAIGITVNRVHGRKESVLYLRQHYPSNLVESMEGVAVFFVAAREQIPVVQFRAISNYIEPRNREAWEMKLAIQQLNLFLGSFLKEVMHKK